jgi:putative OPT family oligopeptide transporter
VTGIQSLRAVSAAPGESAPHIPRTERNMSFNALRAIFFIATLGTLILYVFLVGSFPLALAATVVMVPASFLFTAVATYIVGLVGSSNSPVSGMTICALLLAVFVIWAAGGQGDTAILATLGVAGVVCCVACSAGDVAQDLKTGQLVGSTPSRQQWAEVLGVVVPAFFLTPVLVLLDSAYGIGDKLQAPQATLFASLVKGFFGGGDLPWPMIGTGLAIGVAIILLDSVLERSKATFRLYVMPIAVGIYLPLALSVPIMIGGVIHFAVTRARRDAEDVTGAGILFGSGLIAGEALMGIGLAIPLALGRKIAQDMSTVAPIVMDAVSLALFAALVAYFARIARKSAS